jgi:signal transduction histidine kinase
MGDQRVKLLRSVKSKLLLAFAGSLTAITLLNTGLNSYLTNRQGEAEALSRLSQQLMKLQDYLQDVRQELITVAQGAANHDKNLSDMAIVYSQQLTLRHDPDTIRDRALSLHKTVSLNRLQLILASARLSSLAVYLDGDLSHYVTRDRAGMSVRRDGRRAVISTPQTGKEKAELENAQAWLEEPLPALVEPRMSNVYGVTAVFDFPAKRLMVLRVVVPIQATTRESFNEIIAENLAIATREGPRPMEAAGPVPADPVPADTVPPGTVPTVIGLLAFSQAFDTASLQEAAGQSGVLPAVLSRDGRHRLQLVDMKVPLELLSSHDDRSMRLQTVEIGDRSYYQALKLWQIEAETALILGAALSRSATVATIRQTLIVVIGVAALMLSIGVALGYVLIARMVTPIKALTAGAASMRLDVEKVPEGDGKEHALYGALGRYLERPVEPQADDEIGELTTAFNTMAGRLHDLIGNLRRSHRTLEAESAQRRRAEGEVRALNQTLSQQVRERTSQLEAANRELESFSYSVSHDLRAPLRSLDGFSRALLEDYDAVLDDNGRDYLRRIRVASQRMGHLIDDMLNLARVTRAELHRTPVDLTALASSVADELQRSEPGRQVELVIAPNLRASGDPRLLQVLLQNLLHNARKFTSTRAAARIECGQTLHNGLPVYFVRDNGVGFDMAYAHKLFGAFQRLHATSEFPGSGIGLATVHRIVVRHGGRVWAESAPERGATFYFTLPEQMPSAA